MAAHVLTALREISEHPMPLDHITAGLGFAMWGDQLDFSDWEVLYHAPDAESARKIATNFLPKYQAVWEYLKRPADAEDWNQAWYALKGRAKGKYRQLHFAKVVQS